MNIASICEWLVSRCFAQCASWYIYLLAVVYTVLSNLSVPCVYVCAFDRVFHSFKTQLVEAGASWWLNHVCAAEPVLQIRLCVAENSNHPELSINKCSHPVFIYHMNVVKASEHTHTHTYFTSREGSLLCNNCDSVFTFTQAVLLNVYCNLDVFF